MIYLFSGLGADYRVFEYLQWDNVATQVIEWNLPEPGDTLKTYTKRLLEEQIAEDRDNIFIGVSFGGIVAQQVAQLTTYKSIILISSAQNKNQLPLLYRWFGKLNLDKLLPARLLNTPTFFTYYFFGVSNQTHKQLLKNILQTTDQYFLKWAIRQILQWESLQKIENLMHIHGDNDRILPIKHIKNPVRVKGGGHLMVVTHAEEISKILKRCLA